MFHKAKMDLQDKKPQACGGVAGRRWLPGPGFWLQKQMQGKVRTFVHTDLERAPMGLDFRVEDARVLKVARGVAREAVELDPHPYSRTRCGCGSSATGG